MRFIISFGLALLLSSCAIGTANYYTRTVDSWRGGNVNTLLKRWGAPDVKMTSLEGDTIYVYKTQSYRHANLPASPTMGVNTSRAGRPVIMTEPNNTWHRGTLSVSCVAAFVVNSKGMITDTQVKGNGCYGSENFANSKANPNVTVVQKQ